MKIRDSIIFLLTATGVALISFGLVTALREKPKPCDCDPCFEVNEKWAQLADECIRCRDHEAKNWQRAAQDKTDELIECLELKDVYESQNKKWEHGEDRENQSCTCGPYKWTCQEATIRAAQAERAYNTCKYDGYFPGYTILDSWMDDLADEHKWRQDE